MLGDHWLAWQRPFLCCVCIDNSVPGPGNVLWHTLLRLKQPKRLDMFNLGHQTGLQRLSGEIRIMDQIPWENCKFC